MIPDDVVDAAAKVIASSPLIDAPKLPAQCWYGMARAALEAAGVGELIEALRWYASSDAWKLDQIEGPYGDYGERARAVIEKMGVRHHPEWQKRAAEV